MMRAIRTSIIAAALMALGVCANAAVVRPAPNFGLLGTPHATSLRSLHGQSVVILFTRSARGRAFREMARRMHEIYGQFATEKVVFVAVVGDGGDKVPSDIPFVMAANPGQVASDYGVGRKFAVAVVGVDGNLDLMTEKMISANKVRDAVFNNYESQVSGRKM